MKKNKLFVLLFCALAGVSVASADTQAAAVAADCAASMEAVCGAVGVAVKNAEAAPAEILRSVVAARSSWTVSQVAGIYKSILMASEALSASFAEDVEAFEEAGKPTSESVSADASEGVKLLAALYGLNVPGVNADVVLASVVADSMGSSVLGSVAPLRDVRAGSPARRSQPAKPTPPATSVEN